MKFITFALEIKNKPSAASLVGGGRIKQALFG